MPAAWAETPTSRTFSAGAAASQAPSGNHGLGVYARNNGAPEDAWGQFRFGEDTEGGHGQAAPPDTGQ